ncbi:MAG: 1,4-alpha-glucan branching protein GlgB [Phycisphaerae bacterium]
MIRTEPNSPKLAAPPLGVSRGDWQRLTAGEHHSPHDVLGAHPAQFEGRDGLVIRAYHPDAQRVDVLTPTSVHPMSAIGAGGLFAAFLPEAAPPIEYQLRFSFADGNTWERDDPYRFLPTLGDVDLHLFNEGTHRRLWEKLGAHARTVDGVPGVSFAVWAPNAARVSVVGDFCQWDGRLMPMRQMGSSGVFELFIPNIGVGTLYKFEIKTKAGNLRLKADPMGRWMERPPGTASRVVESHYEWGDQDWLERRKQVDIRREAMSIYEVHLGSWRRVPEDGYRPLNYREIAPRLVSHMKRFGFTHLELMPVAEFPFAGSWGYQVTGYYAPTSRYGTPDDFRYLVDTCHRAGIGVIVDWVPAHFCKDDFALRLFDGTPLYEHDDPRLAEHPDWGTLIFNYGRNEVRNFLVANALYWLSEFHIDGLRVDAVASMLYLDYSRKEGEWIPNRYGGRENIEAIELLRQTNELMRTDYPGCYMIAEESTAWGGVTAPAGVGGLGFAFKWNMGWMHDTLLYFSKDPVHRRFHHNELTFSMIYEYTERFINPLSHDEVVHGKRSLLEKMPGDLWQKFANLRALLAYQYLRPGKKLLFMGTEVAPYREWNHDESLDWHLADDPHRVGLGRMLETVGRLYVETPLLWRTDSDPYGFAWIDCHDSDHSVYSFLRREGDQHLVVVMNLTPVPRDGYRVGVPHGGAYRKLLCTDDEAFGGSGYKPFEITHATAHGWHCYPHSIELSLPPLAVIALRPE